MCTFSIITPVYNNIEYIEKCILNVISQGKHSLEHLIIDGGSSDGTVQIIQKYALQYSHISWVSEKDKGQSDAMNKGIKLAKGEFISFLNVDDYYSLGTLNEVSTIISNNTLLSFIVGNCNVWDEKNELIYVNRPRKLKPWHILGGSCFPVNPSAYFYKKEIHDIVGGYNEENHFSMDLEFLIETSFVTEMNYYPRNWGNFRVLPFAKTGNDQINGTLEQKKNVLLNKYIRKSNLKLYLLTYSVKFSKSSKKKIHLLIKLLMLPFKMVYWKIRKSFFSRITIL